MSFLQKNNPALLIDWKCFERSKNSSAVFRKTAGLTIFLHWLETISGSKNCEVSIQGNSTLWPMGKTPSCDPLRQ